MQSFLLMPWNINFNIKERNSDKHTHNKNDDSLDILGFEFLFDFGFFDVFVCFVFEVFDLCFFKNFKKFQNSDNSNNPDDFGSFLEHDRSDGKVIIRKQRVSNES